MIKSLFRAALSAAAILAMTQMSMAHEFKLGDLEIKHPWSRPTVPGAKVAAGYIVVKNNGTTPDRLIGATGAIAGKGEIHEMKVDGNGVMTMRQLADGVEIPAGGEVALAPGGLHIMFMQLNAPAVEGEKFKGSLTFEKAGTVDVEFAVEKPKAGEAADPHAGHGSDKSGHEGHGG